MRVVYLGVKGVETSVSLRGIPGVIIIIRDTSIAPGAHRPEAFHTQTGRALLYPQMNEIHMKEIDTQLNAPLLQQTASTQLKKYECAL